MEPVKAALADSNLSVQQISKVLMVGGSSRIPAVQQAVKDLIGKEPFRGINPDECVAMGACLQGGVLSAIVVGVARGILQVVTKGHILDTIIHSCVAVLENLSLYLSGFGMLVFQTFLNLLIPSGSGQAAVSMPIMTPIADLIGMNRQIAVLIFQFGDGFSNLLWPTGFMMIVCAMVKIPLNKYYKWLLPFFGILFVLQVLFVFGAIAIGYGPM